MKSNFLKIAASVGLTTFVLYVVFRTLDVDLEKINFKLDWPLVLVAVFFYFAALILKAVRFRFFLSHKISLSEMFSIVSAHSFWNNILPFRSGELSYLYLLRKHGAVGRGEGITSLLVARIFDASVVMIFFAISVAFFLPQGLTALFGKQISVGIGFASAFIVGFALIIFYNSGAVGFLDLVIARFVRSKQAIRVFERIREVILSFSRVKNFSEFLKFFFFSVAVWIADLFFVWAALEATDISLSFGGAFFIAAFPVAAALLPLQNPAGLGTFEGVLAGGLIILGISPAVAFGAGFLLHLELLFASFLFFCFSLLTKKTSLARTHTELYATFENPDRDFRNLNLSNLLLDYATGSTLLDIGSGNGLLLRAAKKRGFSVFGIEPDAALAELSRKSDSSVPVAVESLEFYEDDRKYDTVVLEDVLECIEDDGAALRKAALLVKEGGRIVMSVPAYPWLFGSRDRMLGYFRRYDYRTVADFLGKAGFMVVKRRYWNMIFLPLYFIFYKVFRKETHFEKMRGGSRNDFLSSLISGIFRLWFKYIENTFNFGFGLTLIVVAEKQSCLTAKLSI